MNECILITGGAGFIGSALSRQLEDEPLPVVAFDNLHAQIHPTRSRPPELAESAILFRADVCRAEDWDRLLETYRPRHVVHLAAETGTGQSLTESARHAEVNVVGTAQMLDAFSRHAVRPQRIVLSSSRAVYGEGAWRHHHDGKVFYPGQRDAQMLAKGQWDFPGADAIAFDARRTRTRPTSIYGATKLAQEHMLSSWCRSFDIEHAILRLQNVYGPGQALNNPYTGIVPLFSRLAKAGESIPLYEDGEMLRDFVHIDDVATAIRLAMTAPGAVGDILDIGSGRSLTIAELAQIVAAHYGAPPAHVSGQFRNGDVRHAACRPEHAMERLQWSPSVSADVGIPGLCEWIDGRLEHERGLSA